MTPLTNAGVTSASNSYKPVVVAKENPDLYEYILVVNTGGDISRLLMDARESFHNRYLQGFNYGKQPYIKVAGYKAKEAMEPTLERWIQRVCGNQKGFRVMLNNFSGFPQGKLFVRVQHHEPFRQLVQSLGVIDDYIKSYGCPSAKMVTHPHVTIASAVPQEIYIKAMLDYSQRDFNGSFNVDELVLLRRKFKNEAYKKINVFKLLPLLVTAVEAV